MDPRALSIYLKWPLLRFGLIAAGLIFGVELILMWALPWILPPGAPYWIGAIVDASALAVICGPLLWFTSVRPVRRLAILAAGEYVQILDHAADAIIVIDEKGRIETFNAAAERAFGYAAKEALDHNVSMLMSSPHSQDHDGYLQRYSQTGVRHVIGMSREVVGRQDGREFPCEIHVSELRTAGRRLFTGIVQDISERKKKQAELQEYWDQLATKNDELETLAQQLADLNTELSRTARHDGLTNLLNRGAWEEGAQLEHERHRRYRHRYSILMIDVDHFKLYNDQYGHPAGDRCLQRVAEAIRQSCRNVDLVGRYGGEEFVVLLPETELSDALVVAERVVVAVRSLNIPHERSKTASCVTASVGAAGSSSTEGFEPIVKAADDALYEAKKSGRNRVATATQVEPMVAATASK